MFLIPKFKELSFLVYGLGLSGRSVVNFFQRNKIYNFKVWDDKQIKLLKKYRTKNLKETLNKVDYIILSPGISSIKNKILNKYKNKILTDIDLFFLKKIKSKSIIVTGTNGKSTTCKLIEHVLKKNKLKCSLGGNIGVPILDLKVSKNNFVIIEASSFQLAHSQFVHPNYAMFLNLSNDHLDWHGNMRNYLNSKLKIFKHQNKNDYAIINDQFKKIFMKKNFLSKPISPNFNRYKKFKSKIQNKYLTSNMNDQNMSFVYTLASLLKIKKNSFIKSLKTFKGLPHRFEIFIKKNNVTFVNDSKATSFKATESALSSLKNIYWILGGQPKKNDKINIFKYKKNIIKCYLIGKNIDFFKRLIKGKLAFSETRNLKNSIIEILKDIKSKKKHDKTILLSPAAASFDQYSNFERRGEVFKKVCRIYARKFI